MPSWPPAPPAPPGRDPAAVFRPPTPRATTTSRAAVRRVIVARGTTPPTHAARGLAAIVLIAAWVLASDYVAHLDPVFLQYSPSGAAGLVLYVAGHEQRAARAYRHHFAERIREGRTAGDPAIDALLIGDVATAERLAKAQLAGGAGPLTLAEIALDRGAPDRATTILDAFLARDPDSPDALVLLAVARTRAGDADRAIAALNRLLQKGEIGTRVTPFLRALETTGALRRRAPARRPLALIAEYYRYLRVFDPSNGRLAQRWAEAAIAHGDHAADAALVIGVVDEKEGRLDAALAAYRRAAALAPDDPEPYRRAAMVYMDSGDVTNEYAMIRRAFDLRPTDPVYVGHLATVLRDRLGDAPALVSAMQRVLAGDPQSEIAHRNLGWAYGTLGDERRALEEYRQAAALDPADAVTVENVAWALGQLRRYDEAAAEYRRAATMAPARPRPHAGLGNMYRVQRKRTEAIAEYERAIALGDRTTTTREDLCNEYFAVSRFADATACFEILVRVDPGNLVAGRSLGQSRYNALLQAKGHL